MAASWFQLPGRRARDGNQRPHDNGSFLVHAITSCNNTWYMGHRVFKKAKATSKNHPSDLRKLRRRPSRHTRSVPGMRSRSCRDRISAMKRVCRWVLNSIASVSLLLCLATAILWMTSNPGGLMLSMGSCGLYSQNGQLIAQAWPLGVWRDYLISNSNPPIGFQPSSCAAFFGYWSIVRLTSPRNSHPAGTTFQWTISVHDWFLCLLFALPLVGFAIGAPFARPAQKSWVLSGLWLRPPCHAGEVSRMRGDPGLSVNPPSCYPIPAR